MKQAQKLSESLTRIEERINAATPEQMHNAMINCERLITSFGKGWQGFRTWHFEPVLKNGVRELVQVYDQCTKEQMLSFVAHKRDMLAQHNYLLKP